MPYLMPNGKWRAQRMIDGKRKSKLFVTKKDAKAWEAEQTEELWNPRQEQLQTHTVCWLELCTEYLKQAEERFSNKTFEEKRLSCKRSLLVVPHDQVAKDVTVSQATEVMRKVGKDSSGYAANKTRKNLAAMWEWGRKIYGLPPENPFRESEKLPADRTPRYVPPEADFWKVYDACKDSRDKALLLFLLHTGARIQEAFRLERAYPIAQTPRKCGISLLGNFIFTHVFTLFLRFFTHAFTHAFFITALTFKKFHVLLLLEPQKLQVPVVTP